MSRPVFRFAALFAAAVLLSSQQKPLYQDPSAPLDRRVDDLVSRMTLEEKVGADDERRAGHRAARRAAVQLVERVPARRGAGGTRDRVPAGDRPGGDLGYRA